MVEKIQTINEEITKANEMVSETKLILTDKWSYETKVIGNYSQTVTISTDLEDYSEDGSNGHDIHNDFVKQVFKVDGVPAIEFSYDDEICEHVVETKILNAQALNKLIQSLSQNANLYM